MAATKFTPEMRSALLDRIERGASIPDAAAAEALHESTLKGWLARGREESEGDYAEFAEGIEAARSAYREQLERPMDREELEREVWKAVRAGSVAAMKLAWEILKARKAEDPGKAGGDDPFAQLDADDAQDSPVIQLDNERRRFEREKRRSRP